MPSTHAILAPSASKRWMTCTPSARAEADCPDSPSTFALEGTLAHSLSEECLRDMLRQGIKEIPEFDQLGSVLSADFWTNAERIGSALQDIEGAEDFDTLFSTVFNYYVAPVFEDFLDAKAADPEAQLLVEAELKLGSFIPEGFGSSDAVIIYGDTLHVYDLKYGRGVKVEAEGNTQMMCYALGAALGPAELYAVKGVMMTIIQPRLQHISTWGMTWEELLAWAQNTLKPAAQKAFRGEGEYVPGDHCKFCKVAPRCRACYLRAKVTAEAEGQPEMMTNEEIAEALKDVESIKTWAAHLEEYALKLALNGKKLNGWKVVEGRSIRKIGDQNAAIQELEAAGFTPELYLKPAELKTIGDLEKMLGRNGKGILAPYIIKPQGKPVLAPINDKRPELLSAAEDFKETII